MRSESAPTVKYESLWLPPVENEGSLPQIAADGQLCFVQGRDEVFVYLHGRWQVLTNAEA